jgi:hypothetical protein
VAFDEVLLRVAQVDGHAANARRSSLAANLFFPGSKMCSNSACPRLSLSAHKSFEKVCIQIPICFHSNVLKQVDSWT